MEMLSERRFVDLCIGVDALSCLTMKSCAPAERGNVVNHERVSIPLDFGSSPGEIAERRQADTGQERPVGAFM